MTVFASVSQLQAMDVVALVTGVTVSRGLVLIEASCMATVACHHTMLTEQRIFGVPIVVEDQRFPVPLRMAFLAFLPEAGVVDIILFMAGITVRRGFLFVEWALVTALAGHSPMVSLQRV
jgi:hypothetical protein